MRFSPSPHDDRKNSAQPLRVPTLFLLGALLMHTAAAAPCPKPRDAEELKKTTVGLLVADKTYCTATLVAPRVILTAARCVARAEVKRMSFTLDSRGSGPGVRSAAAAAVLVHPAYFREESSRPPAADVALVRLENEGYGAVPSVFYDIADGARALTTGARAFLIGYGLDRVGEVGRRRTLHIRFGGYDDAALSPTEVVAQGLLLFSRGDEGDLPCLGDAGAPVLKFAEGETRIVALHAFSAFRNRRDRSGRWLAIAPERRCRQGTEAVTTALGPYLRWIREQRDLLDKESGFPAAARCTAAP